MQPAGVYPVELWRVVGGFWDSINRQTDRLQLYFDACHAIALEAQQNEFVLDSGRFHDILDRETLDNLLAPTPKASFDDSFMARPPDGDFFDDEPHFTALAFFYAAQLIYWYV
ncbi:unnamed protein product [Dibothriocephalus latus]|uniref:Uncharacterized protein n=1 Tax=Dibothriocephalus latus TaxID=60516 RepID=A0A3P7MFD3_DIBLA|nr:unnamed protein product [Dibothriocephalus latus]